MNSLLARAGLRYLAKHPAQLALAILGVAVGVAVAVGVEVASESVSESFRRSTRALAGSATHVVRASDDAVPARVFVGLALDPLAPPAAPIVSRTVVATVAARRLELLGVDPFSEARFREFLVECVETASAAWLLERGACVSRDTAAELGLAPGGELALRDGPRELSVRIAAVLEPRDALERDALASVVLVDLATAQDLASAGDVLTRIDLALPSDEAMRASALRRVERDLPAGCWVEPASLRSESLEAMTRAFDVNLSALGLLALLVGVFLVYNTMTFAVVQRRPLWGMLRAVGGTGRALFRHVMLEALAIGAAGTLLGVALGLLLAQALAGLLSQTVNDLYYAVKVSAVELSGSVLAEAFALGIGATLAGALFPALDAMRTEPRAVLDRALPESRLRARMGWLAALGAACCLAAFGVLRVSETSLVLGFAALFLTLLGAAFAVPIATVLGCRIAAPLLGALGGHLGRVAARGVTRHLARSSVAIAALAVAVSATAGIGILVDSFRTTVASWLGAALVADVYASAPSAFANRDSAPLDPQFVERAVALPSVRTRSSFRDFELFLADGSRVFASVADLPQETKDGYRFLEGDKNAAWRAFDERDSLLVSESLARRRALHVGSMLDVRTPSGVRPFEVLGVFRDYTSDRGWALVSRARYEPWFGASAPTAIGLFLEPGASAAGLLEELRAIPGSEQVKLRTRDELIGASLEVFDRTFAVTRVLRWLAAVVAVLGVAGALLAIELERERETGVLRALGLTPGGLRRVVIGQTGLMGVLAGVFALPMGVATAMELAFVIHARSFGWTVDVRVDPWILAETIALAAGSALVAGLYPAWRLARSSPSRALRGE